MTMTRGTMLGVESTVDGESYDVPHGAGYGIATQITVDGAPGEQVMMDSVWDGIEEAGELPVYVKTRLTYSGHEWPWTEIVSKFDVEYQAVHMAEGSILAAVAVLMWTLIPLVAEFIFVLLTVFVTTYVVLKAIDIAKWLKDQDLLAPAVGIGLGTALVIGFVVLGGNKR